jgi:hypothetical protein
MTEPINLREKYPELFKECFDLSIGPGWVPIVDMALGVIMGHRRYLQQTIETAKQYLDGPYWTEEKLKAAEQALVEYEATLPQIHQIKEKFGQLRIYYKGANSVGNQLVFRYAEQLANQTCEDCGTNQKVKLREGGWWRTLCDPCELNRKQ